MEMVAAASAAVEWVEVGWRRAVVLTAGCLPMAAAGTWRRWGGDRAAQVAPGVGDRFHAPIGIDLVMAVVRSATPGAGTGAGCRAREPSTNDDCFDPHGGTLTGAAVASETNVMASTAQSAIRRAITVVVGPAILMEPVQAQHRASPSWPSRLLYRRRIDSG